MSAEEMKRSVRTFVLIKVEPKREKNVMEKLLEFDEVIEVHIIPGEMDLMAVLETKRQMVAPSSKKVVDFIMDKIENIPEVQDTETILPIFSKIK